jgi:Protein of unknown function DUF86
VVAMFRKELRALLSRLRRAKLLGQEVELDESLDQLERTTEHLSELKEPIAPPVVETPKEDVSDDLYQIRELTDLSPNAALALVAAELERAVRHKLGALGQMDVFRSRRPLVLRSGFEELARRTDLPMETLIALRQFSDIRNRIVHGYSDIDREEVRRAIDLGLDLLAAVKAVPSEIAVVLYPHVEVYADPEGKEARTDCHGIMLDISSPNGSDKRTSVFPTTRTHFVKGMRVAWEWSSRRQWGESWYRHPESDNIEYAWSSSLEFVGRNLAEM